MTGFGRTAIETGGKSMTVEIRTLNSKQLDLSTHIAPLFRNHENDVRSIIARELERGKIDFSLSVDSCTAPNVQINKDLASAYYHGLTDLSDYLQVAADREARAQASLHNYLQMLRMPDVVSTPAEELSDELWEKVQAAIVETCRKVSDFRISEGTALAGDFTKRITMIRGMVDEITPHEKNRIAEIRARFDADLHDLAAAVAMDPNRLEQEIFFYIEKLDITEEKVRLCKHCQYFLETMNEPQANGKKLGFIVQECGREINTLGSKANNFEIQQIVVRMKDELEKLKEQIANVL